MCDATHILWCDFFFNSIIQLLGKLELKINLNPITRKKRGRQKSIFIFIGSSILPKNNKILSLKGHYKLCENFIKVHTLGLFSRQTFLRAKPIFFSFLLESFYKPLKIIFNTVQTNLNLYIFSFLKYIIILYHLSFLQLLTKSKKAFLTEMLDSSFLKFINVPTYHFYWHNMWHFYHVWESKEKQ